MNSNQNSEPEGKIAGKTDGDFNEKDFSEDFSKEALWERILTKARSTEKKYDEVKLQKAYEVSFEAHDGVRRKSGEPYIVHPVEVAEILLELCMDTDTIAASLLHDVVEDNNIMFPLSDIRRRFGDDIANLVDGVTKIGFVTAKSGENIQQQIHASTAEERKNENVRKILISMCNDTRVFIIKLADRLHNMRTLGAFRVEKQKRIALESMSFYAPIAHRLGIAHMKDELEDRSLYYLDNFAYKEIVDTLERHKLNCGDFIEQIKSKIQERLRGVPFPSEIEGRVKGIYSLYKKMYATGKTIDEIYDVYAVRVIIESPKSPDCYTVMGEVHDMYKPIPMTYKDYIASPKLNGYQSLHTTVLGRERIPFEVQIRTRDMHNTARYGVAAHWRYKSGTFAPKQHENKFDYIRQLLEQQQQSDDVDSLSNAIKTDLSPDEVHPMTPKGESKTLPKGSTVVDFAYLIHTQVGNKMIGAKIRGKQVSFDHALETGDVVEIITSDSPNHGPTRSWLDYAKTSHARAKIQSWLKSIRRPENISSGRALIDSVLRRDNIKADDESLDLLAKRHKFNSLEALCAAIGYGGVKTTDVTDWIQKELGKKPEIFSPPTREELQEQIEQTRKKKQSGGVSVKGIDDCRTRFASCCNPLPGDDIIGFVTRGYGVSIHKRDCTNITARMDSQEGKERLIEAEWAETENESYCVTIEIIGVDRKGLLMDIIACVSSNHIPIISNNSRTLKNGNAFISLTFSITGMEQLNKLIARLNKVAGVISVERTGNRGENNKS
ncbi:MAG: bifunctional (p)ppGpp synthetase/guanosine-3',5'-bis(diphosphate) 3'-pyrophosphohydrolase [Oscillospiraceae bacterium]|nr:bifunctional (p)ppGpp synthetase/guanosine-3',5'-bis(diphosphate) 3'-pyrophosphohydrolase [Oscillospiraceae bacterium]